MRLSNKGRYGVRALFHIAFYRDGAPTQIREIAKAEMIPMRFLEQICQDLKKAGLLGSKRGPRGGYHLSRPASEISLGDVIRALEGPLATMVDEPAPPGSPRGVQVTHAVFRDVAANVERCFDSVSLADLCARGSSLGGAKTRPTIESLAAG